MTAPMWSSTKIVDLDTFDAIRALLSAASETADADARTLYLARARSLYAGARHTLTELGVMLDAAEKRAAREGGA